MLRRFEEAVRIGERYTGTSGQFALMALRTACARYELDGNRSQFVSRVQTAPALGIDPAGMIPPYTAALFAGDLSAAARWLSDPRFVELPSTGNTLLEPVALCRAMLARLLNQDADAAAYAAEADAFFCGRAWTSRQEPVVALNLARAAAYAGKTADALKLADALRREVSDKVTYDDVNILNELGRVYALLGARAEALACLRIITTGPSYSDFGTPRIIRIDPCWSRIADDPRFDEILKSAKPL